jgi:hypothetical protein
MCGISYAFNIRITGMMNVVETACNIWSNENKYRHGNCVKEFQKT